MSNSLPEGKLTEGSLPLKARTEAREERGWESEFSAGTFLCPPPPSTSAAGLAAMWGRMGRWAAVWLKPRRLMLDWRYKDWIKSTWKKKENIIITYINNRVEETFPQLSWFQIRCLERTTFSFTQSKDILTASNTFTFKFKLFLFYSFPGISSLLVRFT